MKTDVQLKKDVTAELDWDPSIRATAVGVLVKDGVVTLTGHLDTFVQKFAIERTVQHVAGVRAIAVELDVKLDPSHKRSDSEIAATIESAFAWHVLIPADRVQVKVEKGFVNLKGEVDWAYERDAIEKSVRPITGVVGVTNAITLKPCATPTGVSKQIHDALVRQAELEAKNIDVKVIGSEVTLLGAVHSWRESAAIQRAAWFAPGVNTVVNELRISP